MHVTSFPANEGFINFNPVTAPAEFRSKERILHRKAQPLKHEPCRLLRDSQRAVKLHAANSVLAVGQHPKCHHPFVKTDRRILKDRVDLERKLPIASSTEPQLARLYEVVLFRAAARTRDLAIGPAKGNSIVKGLLRIGEVNDGFLECARALHG